jgi:hypothetical protein
VRQDPDSVVVDNEGISRRNVLVSISAISTIGISGCVGGDNSETDSQAQNPNGSSNPCSDEELEATRIVASDASTVDIVIENRTGEQIKPDEVTVIARDGSQFSIDVPFGSYVNDGDTFSAKVEINGGPDYVSQIDLRYYDSQGNNPTTSRVCIE